MRMLQLAGFVTLLTMSTTVVVADDWSQWLGDKRDGVYRETGSLESFPKEGLKARWRTPVGAGYAGPAVAGGRVYVTDRLVDPSGPKPASVWERGKLPGKERVQCLNEADGTVLWTHEYDCPYTISYAGGPRTTPAVDGDRVYTLGAEGNLFCLDAKKGNVIWTKSLASAENAAPMWGFAGHPLVDGDRLIVMTSNKKAIAMALNKMTGDVLWTALAATEPGYSAPIIYTAGGKRQLIIWDVVAVNSLNPETGEIYWSIPIGPAKYGVVVMTPQLYHDEKLGDVLLVTSQYEGTMLIKLDPKVPKASLVWHKKARGEALHTLVPTPVIRDGVVYGVENHGPLIGFELTDGKHLWETTSVTTYKEDPISWSCAFLTPLGETGSRYFIANEHGDLILADLTRAGCKEISRTHVIEPTNTDAQRPVVWSHPAYANKSIYWRNDKELICASLASDTRSEK